MTGRVLACFHDEWEVALGGGDVIRCRIRGRQFTKLSDVLLTIPDNKFWATAMPTLMILSVPEQMERLLTSSMRLPRM